jgi:hypothetical protein
MCQSSKLASGVRFPGGAQCAASSAVERWTLNPGRREFDPLAAHHAEVKGTGIPHQLKPGGLRVRLAPSALNGHWENWQIRRALDPEFPGSRPGWPASPPRTACGPAPVRPEARFDTGWRLRVLVDQTAGVTIPRRSAVRVRIAPGTPRRLSSSGRTSGLYPEGDPFKSGRRLQWGMG